ncbi:MAG: hypothetical protein FWF50_02825 [Defluviitaleaceae bacterium]|nr:hypothetical protein [Defluviitaleaceae bacterium]
MSLDSTVFYLQNKHEYEVKKEIYENNLLYYLNGMVHSALQDSKRKRKFEFPKYIDHMYPEIKERMKKIEKPITVSEVLKNFRKEVEKHTAI